MIGPTYEEKRRIFERHFLLGKLSGDEIDTLLHFARVERYRAGDEVFSKGSPGQSMMAVLRGTLKMTSVSSDGREIVFKIVYPEQLLWRDCLARRRGAHLRSRPRWTDCDLLVLNRRDFMPILEKHADICLILLRFCANGCGRRASRSKTCCFGIWSRGSQSSCCCSAKAPACTAHRIWRPTCTSLSESSAISQAAVGRASTRHLQAWHRAGLIMLGRGSVMIRDLVEIRAHGGNARSLIGKPAARSPISGDAETTAQCLMPSAPPRPESWIKTTPAGLYCEPGDFYIDRCPPGAARGHHPWARRSRPAG